MRRTSSLLFLVCLVFLIAGFVLGVAVNARYGPNHILFQVQASTKVNLTPRVGDTIDWVDSNNKPVAAHFPGNQDLTPCEGGTSVSHCVVIAPPASVPEAVYPYNCQNCFDPAIGPVSKTGPGGGGHDYLPPTASGPVHLELGHILKTDIFDLLGIDVPPAAPVHPGPTPDRPVAASTGTPVTPALACLTGANRVAVYPTDQSPADSPITVHADDIVLFTGVLTYTATEPTSSGGATLCKDGVIPNPNQACIVAAVPGNYTYTVSATQCAVSPTETFIVK